MNQEIGIISNWDEVKGFGFIESAPKGKKVFFHINDYSYRHKRPFIGLKVHYSLSIDQKGRKCAVGVVPAKGHKNNGKEIRQKLFSLIVVSCFGAVIFFIYQEKLVPIEILYLYPITSVIAFFAYAKDKNAAQSGKWRTPESTLHILSIIGGWPGAKIAQSFLRHKSQKISFRVTYWITVCINCAALYWLTTPEGNFWSINIMKKINWG